eukprot:UN34025
MERRRKSKSNCAGISCFILFLLLIVENVLLWKNKQNNTNNSEDISITNSTSADTYVVDEVKEMVKNVNNNGCIERPKVEVPEQIEPESCGILWYYSIPAIGSDVPNYISTLSDIFPGPMKKIDGKDFCKGQTSKQCTMLSETNAIDALIDEWEAGDKSWTLFFAPYTCP